MRCPDKNSTTLGVDEGSGPHLDWGSNVQRSLKAGQ